MNFWLEELVDLPKFRIKNVLKEDLEIFLILDPKSEIAYCPHCQKKTDDLNQTRIVLIRDLPILGRRVYLKVPRRQFYCRNCQKYFTEPLDFVDAGRRFTRRYESSIYERVLTSSIEQVRREEDLSWDQVNGIHKHQYERQKKSSWGTVRKLGLDEISKHKGHRDFVTVVSDLETGSLIEVIDSRQQEEITKVLMQQPLEVREAVEEVSVDMWRGFPKIIETVFPNAQITIDRFHVMKAINDNLDKLRKQIKSPLKIKGARWLILKNQKDLSPDELDKLEQFLKTSKRLRKAYNLKEEFREIYEDIQKPEAAKQRFKKWLEEARKIYVDAVKTIRNHLDNICNYFLSRTTNGVMEGINNRLKLIKRQAYGFLNFENMRRRFLSCFML